MSITARTPSASPAITRTRARPSGLVALGDPRGGHLLVARRHHLVARREVHPDLEAVDAPALLADGLRRHLGVHDAAPGRHPLHVARRDRAAVPGGVLVLELSLEHVGHRLEAAVRMVGRAHGLARAVVGRPHLVEEQEGIDEVEARGRERTPNDEAARLRAGGAP